MQRYGSLESWEQDGLDTRNLVVANIKDSYRCNKELWDQFYDNLYASYHSAVAHKKVPPKVVNLP